MTAREIAGVMADEFEWPDIGTADWLVAVARILELAEANRA